MSLPNATKRRRVRPSTNTLVLAVYIEESATSSPRQMSKILVASLDVAPCVVPRLTACLRRVFGLRLARLPVERVASISPRLV